MPERGQLISDEDFLALKSLIDAEIGRRGKTEGTAQGQSVGSMAAYRGAAYQYNVTPAGGVSVDAEHNPGARRPGCSIGACTGGSNRKHAE